MPLSDLSIREFLDELASPSPAPGGGSAAALAGAIGAALVAMVCRLTIGRKNYLDVSARARITVAPSRIQTARAIRL